MKTAENSPLVPNPAAAAEIASVFPTVGRVSLPMCPGAGNAYMAAALISNAGRPCVLAVLPGPAQLSSFLSDAENFAPNNVLSFPMTNPAGDDSQAAALRLETVRRLAGLHGSGNDGKGGSFIIATCIQALPRNIPDLNETERLSFQIDAGSSASNENFIAWLPASGYKRGEEVYDRRMFAVRGGVVDVWPVTERNPIRIEFFGDEIESVRIFDPATQRSIRRLKHTEIPPAKIPDKRTCRIDTALPSGSAVIWTDYWESMESAGHSANPEVLEACAALEARSDVIQVFCGDPGPERALPVRQLFFESAFLSPDPDGKMRNVDLIAEQRAQLFSKHGECAKNGGETVFVCLDTSGTFDHLKTELGSDSPFSLCVAPLSGGFIFRRETGPDFVFLSQSDLYGYPERRRIPGRIRESGPDISLPDALSPSDAFAPFSLEHIEPGDFVVHAEYGIGKYVGMSEMIFDGKRSEVICIEYAGKSRLYVPTSKAHLVSRYSGTSDSPIKLHSLAGKRWNNEIASAKNAVKEFAARMLRTQALRMNTPGFAFSKNTPWLADFEAAFPYAETEGQSLCIKQLKADMTSTHPMDRLICGDAGYGKTEIAMRAAFICAMQGKQVAVLTPTTVLAQQHYESFRTRMAEYPVNIAIHSRFCSPAERRNTLKGVANGTVDIVIGTHGILQPDVVFKDLGLVIIDEEQRFGVRHKEHFKTMRTLVDVLTISATPIPRTLYLSLTGARDLSVLKTPPKERVATETKIIRRTDEAVVAAIRRELDRGGQVFYLHNRVMSMELVYDHLTKLLPDARICMAHGKMPAAQIESVTRDFSNGKFDVIVSTTIIGSGIDIPRANTIIIDRADRFGIADLYQLRGRVGRGSVKAYAYLMIPSEGFVDSDARKRLNALRQNSELGSGMELAMRDLGIRGAGNLLGAEQSGHIAAIGFDLYCQLLRAAVANLSGKPPPVIVDVDLNFPFLNLSPSSSDTGNSSSLPYGYIDEDSRRMAFHRRLAECSTEEELDDLFADISDRFGKLPDQTRRLFDVTRCRILAARHGVSRIEMKDRDLRMYMNRIPYRLPNGKFPKPAGKSPDEILHSIAAILRSLPKTSQ